MSESFLRYTDLANAIQLAKAHGLSDQQIIRTLTGSMTHREALRVAGKAAPMMDMTVHEFMRLRRNES